MPTRPGEVAIGARLRRRLHRSIGESITLGTKGMSARVVGIVAVPSVNTFPAGDSPRVGDSAVVSLDQYQSLVPPGSNPQAAVHFRSGTPPSSYTKILSSALPPGSGITPEIQTKPARPVDVAALDAVRRTPLGLSAALAAVAGIGLLQSLASSVRHRRKSLAILWCFGCSPASTSKTCRVPRRAHCWMDLGTSDRHRTACGSPCVGVRRQRHRRETWARCPGRPAHRRRSRVPRRRARRGPCARTRRSAREPRHPPRRLIPCASKKFESTC